MSPNTGQEAPPVCGARGFGHVVCSRTRGGKLPPIVIDFLPRGSFLEVLVFEDVQDNEAEHTLGRFGNADSLRVAVDNFLVNFVARAKGYLEVDP
jgi:hypothetical protein